MFQHDLPRARHRLVAWQLPVRAGVKFGVLVALVVRPVPGCEEFCSSLDCSRQADLRARERRDRALVDAVHRHLGVDGHDSSDPAANVVIRTSEREPATSVSVHRSDIDILRSDFWEYERSIELCSWVAGGADANFSICFVLTAESDEAWRVVDTRVTKLRLADGGSLSLERYGCAAHRGYRAPTAHDCPICGRHLVRLYRCETNGVESPDPDPTCGRDGGDAAPPM